MSTGSSRPCVRVVGVLVALCLLATGLWAQATGSLRGQITDPSGAAVPGASVTATGPNGAVKVGVANAQGVYTLGGMPAGKYTVRIGAPGFALSESAIDVNAGQARTMDVKLAVNVETQTVTVSDTARVDVDPSNNASALVLKGADLEALSDDPDDLQSELQALAGPAAGPDGGQFYIDGFTGGQLPPKESIREIRVNQNPFSAEYDKLGFGRIEVFTKPGTDKYHGQFFFSYGNGVFDSRNPFATTVPDINTQQYEGNFGGPLSKQKASFFIDFSKRNFNDQTLVNATTLDPTTLQISPFNQYVGTPFTRTTVSPRLDYQLTKDITLTARYRWSDNTAQNRGVSTTTLPGSGFNNSSTEHTAQLSETWVVSPKMINETRFEFERNTSNSTAESAGPTISVPGAFTEGGTSFLGANYNHQNYYELQNYSSLTLKTHLLKFGLRVRDTGLDVSQTNGFNGRFTFSSLDAYAQTLALEQAGIPMTQIAQTKINCGTALSPATCNPNQLLGPSQFSITSGNPKASLNQYDLGLYVQDDWRLKPNFTLSLGLRWETQNNIGDHADFAPRVGLAWGIGGGANKAPKLVLRAGSGIFYTRFANNYVLNTIQNNGINQTQYLLRNDVTFFPQIPDVSLLQARTPTITTFDPSLKAPYQIQSVIGIDKQLPKGVTVSVNYINTRGVHQLLTRNINTPLPGTYRPGVTGSGAYPFPGEGPIFQYESAGIFNQNQLMVNSNARVNKWVNLFGFYSYSVAKSNTDSAGDNPLNPYNLALDYSRAGFNSPHRAMIGGSITLPWAIRLSPFITANSGRPFDITTAQDVYGSGVQNGRPAFATSATPASDLRVTPWGNFDINPKPGETIIPRNYGTAPGQFSVNLRVSRTWGFGESTASASRGNRGGGPGGMMGPMMGGPGGGGRGSHGGGGGMFGDSTGHRYNVTLSAMAHNLLNTVNYATPVSNLLLPTFGQSLSIAGGWGATSSVNRRIELQLRFQF